MKQYLKLVAILENKGGRIWEEKTLEEEPCRNNCFINFMTNYAPQKFTSAVRMFIYHCVFLFCYKIRELLDNVFN